MASVPQIWMRSGQRGDAEVTSTSWHYAAGRTRREVAMAKLIRYEGGFVTRGDNDDQVAGMIRGHMAADHPALVYTVSRDDLLSWIQAE
jgi:hypothetical protein